MLKAFFLDFYGTIVYEDGKVIKRITQAIYESGTAGSTAEIGRFWWEEFQNLCAGAFGEAFATQRELERRSLEKTLERFGAGLDVDELSGLMFEYWVRPDIFEDSKPFFERCPLPIYIVSNIDRADVLAAIGYHGLAPAGVFTSEDARAYKPRKELFEFALASTGLKADEVLHIGDSLSSDVEGSARAGIRALWLNRSGREVPEGVKGIGSLLDVLEEMRENDAKP